MNNLIMIIFGLLMWGSLFVGIYLGYDELAICGFFIFGFIAIMIDCSDGSGGALVRYYKEHGELP